MKDLSFEENSDTFGKRVGAEGVNFLCLYKSPISYPSIEPTLNAFLNWLKT